MLPYPNAGRALRQLHRTVTGQATIRHPATLTAEQLVVLETAPKPQCPKCDTPVTGGSSRESQDIAAFARELLLQPCGHTFRAGSQALFPLFDAAAAPAPRGGHLAVVVDHAAHRHQPAADHLLADLVNRAGQALALSRAINRHHPARKNWLR